ncbi:protoglobin domain-containing protein [Arthrobacter sp. ZGTC131]|uniref:protoglobin domain-containing protein n=1 Tax=Arthrobacter sp. ZGTC131 TaxID=2058898 RepID=UPI000CE31EAB|nr:protoglobin domain-containing protein [Arthrobacter sp. ZGTC131]
MSQTPGYAYGDRNLVQSPVSLEDLAKLKATVLWSDKDHALLKRAGEVLVPRTDRILDVWYGFVGSLDHLLVSFSDHQGNPNADYLAAVRQRFAIWIADLCTREYDQEWLDYQNEIALRHTAARKNETDGVDSTSEIHLRYVVAFIVPLTMTIRPFLAEEISDEDELDAVYHAWLKAVTLTATLWAQPYSPSW